MARLCLVTPRSIDLASFTASLEAAVAAGDVASLIIDLPTASDADRRRAADHLTPIAQAADVAVLVRNDTRAGGRAKADGVHIDTGMADLRAALDTFHPGGIVGVGGLETRHEAMEAGETEVDYVFFGDLDRPEEPEAARRALDLAEWWTPLFEPPVVLLGGSTLLSCDEAAATGAEFVALRDAIWNDPRGPAEAVREASARLAAVEPES
ncbi:thiamine phosphate synthase [Pinisolibacter aquiterrae]|uniref:thiamine phosphate synthase n=1 Tax=Pinisolibacter aquiterrae TaxID=2815579 RepID=UPI001C3CEDD0|nr:thiamine phosphate synthase [Pinisolibacter aquiterrae]MCC8237394.1 thiamine phosphate synthase [Pinisolibacter aquiterrae]